MTVYLDKTKIHWRGRHWTHMVADSLEELNEFARLIGVKNEYFDGNIKHPHYDIDMMQVQIALINGAVFVDKREIIKKSKSISFEINSCRIQMDLFD